MRIALFSEVFLPKIDGITNRLSNTIRCMKARGHEVLVFGPSGSVDELHGARVVRVPGLPFPPYPGLEIAAPGPRTVWELMRFKPDVVHAVGPAVLGAWGVAAARSLGLPLVASYHTDFPAYLPLHGLGRLEPAVWPLIRALHNAASLNLAPSRHTRDELEAHGVENVEVWRGGVDTELFHPRRRNLFTRTRLTGGEIARPLLLYAGRLSPEKNLCSLRPLLEELPGVRLALVGDGPARADLERHFADLPVVFPGFLRGEALAGALASADVFVMPSTTETLGFVALEAMASGCPVVAAGAGGLLDIVRHEENGLLYDPAEPQMLLEAVRSLLEDRGRAAWYATQGRKTADEASWAEETRKLTWSYRRAIKRYRQATFLRRLRFALSP